MAVTSYNAIKAMSADFKQMLDDNRSALPFDVENSALVVLVDVATDLNEVLASDPEKLAVIIGLENNRLTICLLGSDAKTGLRADPMPPPLPPPPDGQETWPEGEMIVFDEEDEYNAFFP